MKQGAEQKKNNSGSINRRAAKSWIAVFVKQEAEQLETAAGQEAGKQQKEAMNRHGAAAK
jgi:hypothetical protein